jgi:hypothetical protein
MIAQWQSAATGTKLVNLAQVEAVVVVGSSNPYTLEAVAGSNTYTLDGLSYTTAALAFAGALTLVGSGVAVYPGDATVTTGGGHDV